MTNGNGIGGPANTSSLPFTIHYPLSAIQYCSAKSTKNRSISCFPRPRRRHSSRWISRASLQIFQEGPLHLRREAAVEDADDVLLVQLAGGFHVSRADERPAAVDHQRLEWIMARWYS